MDQGWGKLSYWETQPGVQSGRVLHCQTVARDTTKVVREGQGRRGGDTMRWGYC